MCGTGIKTFFFILSIICYIIGSPKGHPSLEVFLSQIEKELFELAESPLNYSNFSKEEWQAMSSLVNDRSAVIKKADKGSCVVVWDREDYIGEAERQLGDVTVYKDVNFREKMLQDVAETSNKLFRNLKSKGGITEKQLKYFTIDLKRPPIWVSCICCLRFTKAYLKFQVGQ